MAFLCRLAATAILSFFLVIGQAQTTMVWRPTVSSQLLKATAEDMASLLQRATNKPFSVAAYNSMPNSGIIFRYDSTINNNQACRVTVSTDQIILSAREDNGLVFGTYQYLRYLGYRFYQPGADWEIIPNLSSAFAVMDTVFSSNYIYKSWFISGGVNRWIMDNNSNYGWDMYFGENGHKWALYQRRNGMLGSTRFNGHRGDIMNASYTQTLEQNPCYVACYDQSRQASAYSVPDINNPAAIQHWSGAIKQKFIQFQNTIFGNSVLYANQYRNYSYYNQNIGVEVPDGARWGNSTDNSCDVSSYPSASDQQFTLADKTIQQIAGQFPGKRFQAYAYASHANAPSVGINPKLDVMVIPTAFQNETSAKALLQRWYSKHQAVSEYHYLNITQWGGEAPIFYKKELQQVVNRIKEKHAMGVAWEASPAKFASLPYLLAANNALLNQQSFDESMQEFCDRLFGPASSTIHTLLNTWGADEAVTTGSFLQDNRYKLPLYIKLVQQADQQCQSASAEIKRRINELKAYLHYLVLNYDWYFDSRSLTQKQDKAASICLYAARTHKLQIVNSYFVIQDMVAKYSSQTAFVNQYNVSNGTAYQNGNLPLLTSAEIDALFQQDLASFGNLITNYNLETADQIKSKFNEAGMQPVKNIQTRITYTNGMDFNNRTEFQISAPAAGTFNLYYKPSFEDANKGYINFSLENVNQSLGVLKEVTLNRSSPAGSTSFQIPAAGTYKLVVVSRHKSNVEIRIETKGNLFYKPTAFIGNKTENYRNDLISLPGYFYIPTGIDRVIFSVNNSYSNGRYTSLTDLERSFSIRDNNGNAVKLGFVTPQDSSLLYFDVPASAQNSFWRIFKMEQYNLSFANISNLLWYAERKACNNADYRIEFVKKNGQCITRLQATTGGTLNWEVYDLGRWYQYNNQAIVDLPESISPFAIIMLKNGHGCVKTGRLGEDEQYLSNKDKCAVAAPAAADQPVGLYPNPAINSVTCLQNGKQVVIEDLKLFSPQGGCVGSLSNTFRADISHLPSGTYHYRLTVNGKTTMGKLIKL